MIIENATKGKSRKIWRVCILVIAILVLLFSGYFIYNFKYSSLEKVELLRASSIPKGNYQVVINHVCNKLNQKSVDDTAARCVRLIEIETTGSRQTIDQIIKDSVDIGIVQANAPIKKDFCGVIAKLYDEYYMFFSNNKNITNVTDIGKLSKGNKIKVKIGSLGVGSQTYKDLLVILNYYRIDTSCYEILSNKYDETADKLINSEIDLAFFVTSKFNANVIKLGNSRAVSLLEIDAPDKLIKHFQYADLNSIKQNEIFYGFPKKDYKTISVSALLIGSVKKNHFTVYEVTQKLFSKKAEIENGLPYLSIDTVSASKNLPIHPGALDYFKDVPPFWVRNGALITFLGAVLTSIISLIVGIVEIKKLKQ